MTTHEFEIPIHDLDAGGKEYRFDVRASWIRGALEDCDASAGDKDGELDVRVSKSGTDVVVHGRLKAELSAPCARCLKPAAIPVDIALSALMVPASEVKGSRGPEDEYEFSADEADILPYSGDVVVLDDLVRDELALEVPMIPLCSEDCPGMERPPSLDESSVPEDTVDPRLRPLLRFVKNPDSNKE
jgi:uncharacterized protein